ncbi:MAG: DNA polymerase III subunit delta [Lachnospiraceae bacterium]|nr:DNA polymerase III subunit delta [Lachnospiraceae bacterium]
MAELKRVLGQNHIITHFENAVKMDKISHAYIINGEADSGKRDLALRFAMAINCEKQTGEPCMECRSCRQALSGNQPDIKWVTHEKTAISVDDIRLQVNNDIVIKPYSSRKKVYIIPESEKMNQAAQNALLKTIEEPPSYATIILLTANSGSFLQTILSRCVVFNIRPVRDDIIRQYLKTDYNVSDYEARVATAFAEGNPGKAVKLATSDEFVELRDCVVRGINNVANGTMQDIMQAVKDATTYKDNMTEYLSLVRMWFRDMLVYKACKDENKFIFRNETSNLKELCSVCEYNDINEIIEKINYVQSLLNSNVNFEASIEMLYLTIKEKIKLYD